MKSRYPLEFREYVARKVVIDGFRYREVSEAFEIPYTTINNWVWYYRQNHADDCAQRMTETEMRRAILRGEAYLEALRD